MRLSKGDRVVHIIDGRCGVIVGVHVARGMRIQNEPAPVLAGAVTYGVIWDGTNQPEDVDADEVRAA